MTNYLWSDNPTALGTPCNPDTLNECLMHLKYKTTKNFCINSGNLSHGEPDLLSFEDSTLKFKVGGIYPDLILTNAQRKSFVLSSLSDLSVSSMDDGEYIVFAGADGSVETVEKSLFDKGSESPFSIPLLKSNSQNSFISSGTNIASGSAYYSAFVTNATFSKANSYSKLEMPFFMKAKKWVISSSLDTKRIKTGYIEVLDQYDVWTTVVNINETISGTNTDIVYTSDYPNLEFKAFRITGVTNFGATNGWVFGCLPLDYEVTKWSEKEGFVWFDTSKEPTNAYQLTTSGIIEFLKVPIGSFIVSSGEITAVKTFFYNMNGYDVVLSSYAPDYTKGINKNWSSTHTAECNGWVYAGMQINHAGYAYRSAFLKIDDSQFIVYSSNVESGGIDNELFLPIRKGSVYKITENGEAQVLQRRLKFYPCISEGV